MVVLTILEDALMLDSALIYSSMVPAIDLVVLYPGVTYNQTDESQLQSRSSKLGV